MANCPAPVFDPRHPESLESMSPETIEQMLSVISVDEKVNLYQYVATCLSFHVPRFDSILTEYLSWVNCHLVMRQSHMHPRGRRSYGE